jgi:dihydrofolate reductase
MGRIVVSTHVTLDGVMQAPGQRDEDPRGAFEHGAWQRPYADEVIGAFIGQAMASSGGMLLGRRTYENFAAFWPSQPVDDPIARAMNESRKYVVSTTLKEPLAWSNSALLAGDLATEITNLKANEQKDLAVVGSGGLVQSLAGQGLVDEYDIFLHPLVLGSGNRLFEHGLPRTALELVDTKTTTKGVVILVYRPTVS